MATTQTVVVYNKVTGVGGTALVMTASSVNDGAANSIVCDYFVELVAGNASTRVPIAREDFLAIRQLRNLAVP
jgi:hypothetical protein